jgi:Helix-turn-helix
MKTNRRKKLEAAGWKVGTAREFLGLSDEEAAFVELKLTLSASLKKCRTSQGLSQHELAKRLRSSQSRVAKMEASDPAVSPRPLDSRAVRRRRKEERYRQSDREK